MITISKSITVSVFMTANRGTADEPSERRDLSAHRRLGRATEAAEPGDDKPVAPNDGERRFAVPAMHGRHVYLRPPGHQDYEALRLAETTGEVAIRWRFRGTTPSPEQWAASIWHSALAQFLVVRTRDHAPIGITHVYRHSFQDQHAYLGAAGLQPRARSPLLLLGVGLFIEYVFSCWNFQKLYLEVPEYNAQLLGSGIGRLFQLEGRLRRHSYYDGQRWDQLILALYREDWKPRGGRIVAAEAGARPVRIRLRMPEAEERDE